MKKGMIWAAEAVLAGGLVVGAVAIAQEQPADSAKVESGGSGGWP